MCCNSVTAVQDHAQIRLEGRPFKVRGSMCVVLLLLKNIRSGTLTSSNGENENLCNGFEKEFSHCCKKFVNYGYMT